MCQTFLVAVCAVGCSKEPVRALKKLNKGSFIMRLMQKDLWDANVLPLSPSHLNAFESRKSHLIYFVYFYFKVVSC